MIRPCIQRGEGSPRVPTQSKVSLVCSSGAPSCTQAGLGLGLWILENRYKLRRGERRPQSPNFSPTSHHRGRYSTARTVADRRVHLQNPLGHKRLQTFSCKESQGRTSERAGLGTEEPAHAGTLPGAQSAARPVPLPARV